MSDHTQLNSWQALAAHANDLKAVTLAELFAHHADRVAQYSVEAAGIYLDYSKNHLTVEVMTALQALAAETGVAEGIRAMFAGEIINPTEQRASLHTALRANGASGLAVDAEIAATLDKMAALVQRIRCGEHTGATGKTINHVVNIGIGGSDLGPRLVHDALGRLAPQQIRASFVANIDAAELASVLVDADPETTLFVVASKSFTTLETHTNAASARQWLLDNGIAEDQSYRHFVAVTSKPDVAAQKLGVPAEQVLPIWDWVGGRYSVWSAIGFPLALSLGMAQFRQFLAGAHAMDQHFRDAPLDNNMPVLLALIGLWYGNFRHVSTHAVLPYSHQLRLLPNYLQQLSMESLGKRVDLSGQPVAMDTGAILWGTEESNGQHSFHQLLMQGTHSVAIDFVVARRGVEMQQPHQAQLVANCLAQSRALMQGRAEDEVKAELIASGMDAEQAAVLAKHKAIPGNAPSNTLMLEQVDAHSVGALLALYEHRTYVQALLWGINAFDQWGVELGKLLGVEVFDALSSGAGDGLDASTRSLIQRYLRD